MARFDRFYHLWHTLKASRYPVPLGRLANELECTERNTKNIIANLRAIGAPVEYSREYKGYYLDTSQNPSFELPGLWFNASELHALMASHQLLAEVQPGWLNDYIRPLKGRIEKLLDDASRDFQELNRRVRIMQIAARPTDLDNFRKVSEALLSRRRLRVLYHGRARDVTGERTVSPQRLVYYRHNWYLDAWCHTKRALRTFSIDRLQPVELKEQPAKDISDTVLDRHYATAYGIFAGPARGTAHLLFSPEAAKWVADEEWHPGEESDVHPDGSYELKFPYSDTRELVMDILKYGPDVEVLGPPKLREIVADRTRRTSEVYEKDSETT